MMLTTGLSPLKCLLAIALYLAFISMAQSSTQKNLSNKYNHLKYLNEFRAPLSNVIYGSALNVLYKPLFELTGPVKEVSLFQDRAKKKPGDYSPITKMPWNNDYLEFNEQGYLKKYGNELPVRGGYSNALTEFEYVDNRPTRRKFYHPTDTLVRYTDYFYGANGFISKKKTYSSEKGKLLTITKIKFTPEGNNCFGVIESKYDVKKDSTNDFSKQTVCKEVIFNRDPAYMPYLKRGYKTLYYGHDNQDYLYIRNGNSVKFVSFHENGDIHFLKEYRSEEDRKRENYNQIVFIDVVLDKYGNWLERKFVYYKVALGEVIDRKEKLLFRNITYHK